MSARYPDFKHKLTQEALWLDSKLKLAIAFGLISTLPFSRIYKSVVTAIPGPNSSQKLLRDPLL
jgi:hypothetical protein